MPESLMSDYLQKKFQDNSTESRFELQNVNYNLTNTRIYTGMRMVCVNQLLEIKQLHSTGCSTSEV